MVSDNIYDSSANIGEITNTITILDEDGAYLQYCGYLPSLSKKYLSPFQQENNPSFYF